MGYYTRVLSKRAESPTLEALQAAVKAEHPNVRLLADDDQRTAWTHLVLSHRDGTEIAAIERNVVSADSLGAEEIAEFIEAIADARPATAAAWLVAYLAEVRVVYAFQHLSGTRKQKGDEALRVVSSAIWARGDAILQADYEGFSNEDGYHILWQFSDGVSGPWWMAVLDQGRWTRFQMELGDRKQRAAFLAGRVPPGAKTA